MNIRLTPLLLCVYLTVPPVFAQTTLRLPKLRAEVVTSVTVPLTVDSFTDINAISLVIDYSESALTFTRLENQADGITFIENAANGSLRMAWAGFSPVSIADGGTLVDLVFEFNNGTSELLFDEEQCELNDSDGNPVDVAYESGRVSPAGATVLSLPHLGVQTDGSVVFPITVSGFDEVNAISLVIDFTTSVLSFTELANQADGITFIGNEQNGSLRLAWAGFSPVSIDDDGKLVDLVFDYQGGDSHLDFDVAQCELNDIDGNTIEVVYENGGIGDPLASVELPGGVVPEAFGLMPNYPNPFNPQTAITFALPKAQYVRLAIYSLLGTEVAVLVDSAYPAGEYVTYWHGLDKFERQVASGVYVYKLETTDFVAARTMLLLR